MALAWLGLALCACAAVERTVSGPDVSESSKGAEIAREKGYPNVFSPPSERPPLLSPAEQQAAKSGLEQSREKQAR